jgi:hypothetical protein
VVDIDELERLHAEATPAQHDGGDWFVDLDRNDQPNILAGNHGHWVALLPHQCVQSLEVLANARASYIVATHNALPGLIAELRALREVMAVLDRDGGHAQEASTPEQTKARAIRDAHAAGYAEAVADVVAWLEERYGRMRSYTYGDADERTVLDAVASDIKDSAHVGAAKKGTT